MELIYLDTNVYLDYLEGRTDKLRPLGEFAFQLIKRAIECEFKIVVSSFVIEELENNIDMDKVDDLFDTLKKLNKIINLFPIKDDKDKAKELSKNRDTHYSDALHAVLANRAGAEFLVTRNIKHFSNLNDLVKVVYPESI